MALPYLLQDRSEKTGDTDNDSVVAFSMEKVVVQDIFSANSRDLPQPSAANIEDFSCTGMPFRREV